MTVKLTTRTLTLVAVGLMLAAPAMAQNPQDNGAWTGGFNDAMAEIPAMTVPAIIFDFDLMPQGPTTPGDVLAQFPNSAVTGMAFSQCTGSSPGNYGFQPNGRALAANPDLSLGLYLVDPTEAPFGCFDDLTVTFSEMITEFGVQIGDWSGPMNFTVFDGAANVGTIQVNTLNAPVHYVESTVPFDSLVISAFPDNPGANYVFPTLVFPEVVAQPTPTPTPTEEAIPTLGNSGIVLLIILIAGIGLVVMRRFF